jgi:hypothetical protein
MARRYTPGPNWRFELLLGICTIVLLGAALIIALW